MGIGQLDLRSCKATVVNNKLRRTAHHAEVVGEATNRRWSMKSSIVPSTGTLLPKPTTERQRAQRCMMYTYVLVILVNYIMYASVAEFIIIIQS